MFKKTTPLVVSPDIVHPIFPHCDARILHAPGECVYCDTRQDWQILRQVWGIAFTGYEPEGTELPCPADHARGNAHKLWPRNRAVTKEKSGTDQSTEV